MTSGWFLTRVGSFLLPVCSRLVHRLVLLRLLFMAVLVKGASPPSHTNSPVAVYFVEAGCSLTLFVPSLLSSPPLLPLSARQIGGLVCSIFLLIQLKKVHQEISAYYKAVY